MSGSVSPTFAQAALGEIVAVVLPDVGQRVTRGDAFGDIESNKVVDDLVAPSRALWWRQRRGFEDPTVINADPYREGWLLEIEPSSPGQVGELGPTNTSMW